mmetsp:Transcript_33687/g.62874  ORF Transcript_33687/g.62874 Transcript_33687/m.62874 type:complete len:245 (-) Transcript_33687:139-873(-)
MSMTFIWCSLLLAAPFLEARRVQVHVTESNLKAEGNVVEAPQHEEKEGNYVCGALQMTYSACYPKERDYGFGSWAKAKACTAQCQRKMGMCMCPNSGESCTSSGSVDPGFSFFKTHGAGVSDRTLSEEGHALPEALLKRPIRVNTATREWQFLVQTGSSWSWQSPSTSGKSFLGPNAFVHFKSFLHKNNTKVTMAPERTLTEEGHSFPDGPSSLVEVNMKPEVKVTDSCDPAQIASYMQSQADI